MAESKSAALPLGYAPTVRGRPDLSGAARRTIAAPPRPINLRGRTHVYVWTGCCAPTCVDPLPAPDRLAAMTYRAPLSDIAFALKHAAGMKAALAEGLYGDLDEETVDSILAEAGRFSADVIAPLNRAGDQFGTP